jgi:hypothetical protein
MMEMGDISGKQQNRDRRQRTYQHWPLDLLALPALLVLLFKRRYGRKNGESDVHFPPR